MAQVGRLNGFKDLSYIAKYSERFGLDPDQVIKKGFRSVMNFIIMWKEQDEFQNRYQKLNREINAGN